MSIEEERLISPVSHTEDRTFDKSIRPKRLSDYIGQPRIREQLEIFIPAAKARGDALDHTLIFGPPGLGKCITADSYLLTKTGWVQFSHLIPPTLAHDHYQEQQIQVYGLQGLETTSHLYSSGNRTTRRLVTQSGYTLEGTFNHPVLIATPQGWEWRPLGALTGEEWIAMACNMQVWGELQPINYPTPLVKPAAISWQGVSQLRDHICKVWSELWLGLSSHYPKLCYANIQNFEKIPVAQSQIIGDLLGSPQVTLGTLKFPRHLTPPLAYIVGIVVTKGRELGSRGQWLIGPLAVDLITILKREFKALFNYSLSDQLKSIAPNQSHRGYYFTLPFEIVKFFRQLGIEVAASPQLPSAILQSPADTVAACIRAIMVANGQRPKSSPIVVELSSSSSLLITQLHLLLGNFGIIAHRRSQGEQHSLHFNSHAAKLFGTRIGWSDIEDSLSGVTYDFSELNSDVTQLDCSNFDELGHQEIIPYAKRLLTSLLDRNIELNATICQYLEAITQVPGELSRQQVAPIWRLLKPHHSVEVECVILEQLCHPHIYWDQVATLDSGEAQVYDLCVPGSHSFVANGFYNHNTTLAHITANELGVNLRQTSGPILERPGDLAAILTNLEPRDVLFIDEIHRLSPVVEEILYPAMEDFQLDIMIGEGPAARSIKLDLPPFTLIGATTRAGLLTSPLRDRFGITYRLEFYNSEELAQIVARSASILAVPTDPTGTLEIARRSRGTPRIANRLLRRVRDYAQVRADGQITLTIAQQALDLLNVDIYGLDMMDHKLLLTIMEKFEGGPVGVDTLAAAISEERGTIEEVIEPFLLQQGFMMRTPRGRVVTRLAWQHFGLKAKTTAELFQ